MRIIRFADAADRICYGRLLPDGTAERLEGELLEGLRPTGEILRPSRLLAPVIPPVIYCIGMNYRKHAQETGGKVREYPTVFMKAPSALLDPGAPIELPRGLRSEQVDYECELAVVIGRSCKNVNREEALDYVLGYTCGNDVSARDWQIQRGGSQWCRGKTFDTFAPLGPCLVTKDEIANPNRLAIRTIVSGEVLQDWNTDDMIFDVQTIVAFLSGSTTLPAGTVIFTGTPHGVGMAMNPPRWLKAGDSVTVEIEGIGALTNPVIEEKA